MNRILTLTCLSFFYFTNLFSQSNCTPIPEVNFPGGRVIMSFDGNVHDDDDILALPYATGLWWAAGLKDKVVQVEYNNHVCLINNNETDGSGPGSGDDSQNMRNSASGAISRFGYNPNIFYDYETQGNASTSKMSSEIEKSTASNPLWIIAGGPMETVWRGLEGATKGHDHVTVISHSAWNEAHLHCEDDHNWTDLKSSFQNRGVFFVGFCSGSGCSQPSGLNDQNGGFSSAVSNWSWMQNSSKEYNRWIFGRNPFGNNKFDPSDAGMSYYLITGGPFNGGEKTPDHNDARKLMENPCEDNIPAVENIVPTLTIIAPEMDAVVNVGSTVTINLSATDEDGFINKHQIFLNGVLVDTDGNTYSPYKITSISAGAYTIKATVTDNSGASTSKTINISAGSTPTTPPPPPPPSGGEPTVQITSPSDGQHFAVGNAVTIGLSTSEDVQISKHQIFVNGTLVDTDGLNYTPHRITNISAGTHTIKATVTDNTGATASQTISITAGSGPDTAPPPPPSSAGDPSLQIISPSEGQSFTPGSPVTVKIDAADADGSIVRHQVYVNGKLVDTDGSNYTPHKISAITEGNHSIKVVVTDNDGNKAESTVNVSATSGTPSDNNEDTEPSQPPTGTSPSVVFNSPLNLQEVATGSTVSVSVSANDPNGSIVKHQIFVDGKLVDTDGSNFTPHKITNISEGSHVIRATVTDNSGETASASITINASDDPNSGAGGSSQPPTTGNILPSVTILAPIKNQNFALGATVSVKLSATDSDGSIVQHRIYVNGKLVDTDGTNFTPHKIINVKSGTYTIKATVTDNEGGTASQTTSFNVQGITQKQAPVTASQPYRELHIFDRVTDQISPKEDLPYLRVLRNPVKDGVLQVQQHGNTYLRIINLSGITVKELALKEENLEINLSGLAPGLYILSSDIATSKFILD